MFLKGGCMNRSILYIAVISMFFSNIESNVIKVSLPGGNYLGSCDSCKAQYNSQTGVYVLLCNCTTYNGSTKTTSISYTNPSTQFTNDNGFLCIIE